MNDKLIQSSNNNVLPAPQIQTSQLGLSPVNMNALALQLQQSNQTQISNEMLKSLQLRQQQINSELHQMSSSVESLLPQIVIFQPNPQYLNQISSK